VTSDLDRFFQTASPDELEIYQRQGGQLPVAVADRLARQRQSQPQTAKERRRLAREQQEKEA